MSALLRTLGAVGLSLCAVGSNGCALDHERDEIAVLDGAVRGRELDATPPRDAAASSDVPTFPLDDARGDCVGSGATTCVSPGLAAHAIHAWDFDGDLGDRGTVGGLDAVGNLGVFVPTRCGLGVNVSDQPVELRGAGAVLATAPELTLSIWFSHGPTPSHGGMPLVDCRSFGGGGFQSYVGYDGPDLTTCWGGVTAPPYGCGSVGLPSCGWHHLGVTYRKPPDPSTPATFEMRLDATYVFEWATSPSYGPPPPGYDVMAGVIDPALGMGHVGEFEYVPGEWTVDSVRIYDVAVDARTECTEIIGGTWAGAACALP